MVLITLLRLTSEMLEQICKDDDVLEITGEYTGGIGGWSASHEHIEHSHSHKHQDDYNTSVASSSSSSHRSNNKSNLWNDKAQVKKE